MSKVINFIIRNKIINIYGFMKHYFLNLKYFKFLSILITVTVFEALNKQITDVLLSKQITLITIK